MRRIGAWAVCLAAAWSAWAQAPEKGAIAGRVVNATTGAPLKRAAVWVEAFAPARGVNGAPSVAGPSTVTDAQGRFSLENIDPGSYFLSARRTGYLDQGYGAAEPEVVGTPLKLAAGDRMGDVTIKLTPQSLLYGKVTDEDGEAVPDAEVSLYRISYAGGRKHPQVESGTVSQADGSVIIGHVAPGSYYLGASIRGGEQDANAREIYVPTFYPSTPDPAAATPVEVAAGAEVRGLEIRLRKARTFRIRGTAAPDMALRLFRANADLVPHAAGVIAGPDGRFEFTGVLPGRYILETDDSVGFSPVSSGDGRAVPTGVLLGRAMVEVSDGDLEDVALPLGQGAEIAGRVAGGDAKMRTAVRLVALDPGEPHAVHVAETDAKGVLRFPRLIPAAYAIGVSGLADDYYVKAIHFAGRDITNDNLDLTSGAGGTLEITLSADGGEIAGTVHGADGKALPGALVQVWPAGGESARSLKADENGAFRFRGLRPADYRVIAWEALDDDLAEYAPFRARFETQATLVTVAERASETVEVQAVARAASAAEAARLR